MQRETRSTLHIMNFSRRVMRFLLKLATFFLGILLFLSRMQNPFEVNFSSRELFSTGDQSGQCGNEIKHIFFLKTHKCASSTIQNIFLRYGFNNNLSFALPGSGNYLGNPTLFNASMIPVGLLPADGKVDIFAVHTRLHLPEVAKIMPDDTVYVTVVRDPPLLFESLYSYFFMHHTFHMSLEKYIRLPLQEQMAMGRKKGRFGYNMILFNMGVDVNPRMSAIEIYDIINAVDKLFQIVLIAEKLDEGLILMKERLCWSFLDIIFFSKNGRNERMRKSELAPHILDKLRLLNSADVLLYNHFLARHEKAVKEYGPEKMAIQVEYLNNIRTEFSQNCDSSGNSKYVIKAMSERDEESLADSYEPIPGVSTDCQIMMSPELPLIRLMRKRTAYFVKKSYGIDKLFVNDTT